MSKVSHLAPPSISTSLAPPAQSNSEADSDSDSDSDSEVESDGVIRTANTKLAEKILGVHSRSTCSSKAPGSLRMFLSLLFFGSALVAMMLAIALRFSTVNKRDWRERHLLSSGSRFASFDAQMSVFSDEIHADNTTTPAPTKSPSATYPPTGDCTNVAFWEGQWVCKQAYGNPGQGYYLEGGSSGWPNAYPWPTNVSGTLIPTIVSNQTCSNNYTINPTDVRHFFNGTDFFCLNGTLANPHEPPFYCLNGSLIFNETYQCLGALVSVDEELECNTTSTVFTADIHSNCTTNNYTVYVPQAPTNILCNETSVWTNWKFVVGDSSPPICMVIATPNVIVKTIWRPIVDAFTVVQLALSSNNTVWFDCSTAIAIEIGGVSSGPRARFDQGNTDSGYFGCTTIVPFWTIVIHLDNGKVTEIDWDDSCSSCSSVSTGDNCVMGNCAVNFDQCIDMNGPTDCNIKVYVSWTGTDSDGNALLSSNLRLSQFQQFSFSSSWGAATNWGNEDLTAFAPPADNGVPQSPSST